MLDWLKKYKIIFETLVAASLTVMGVLVSIAAVVVAVNANRLSEQSYALQRYGAEPVFTVEWEKGEDGLFSYVIQNVGAEIHDVVIHEKPIMECLYGPEEELFFITPHHMHVYYRMDFDERTQTCSFASGVSTSIINAVEENGDFTTNDQLVVVEINYRNYLHEYCGKRIVISVNKLTHHGGRVSLEFDDYDVTTLNDPHPSFFFHEEFNFSGRLIYGIDTENTLEKMHEAVLAYHDNYN